MVLQSPSQNFHLLARIGCFHWRLCQGRKNIVVQLREEIQGDDGKRKMRNKWTQEDKEGSDECSVLQKKARVVWTAELHHNFVAAINIIGLEKAVPKKILELMKGHGLSRSNIASHLQKYREYLKRPENADKSGFSFIKPSCFSNEIHTPDPFPRSRPPFLYNYPQQFPQFPEQQQNPLAPFQLGFEGNVNGLKSLCSVPPVVPSQFHNKKVSSNSFMAQARHGQSISVSNQGNMQQSLPGNALFDNQQTLGGCPTFALREPLHVDNSVASGNAMPSMVHQQPQLRPGFLPSAPVEQACNNTSPQGQNSHPSPASIRVGSIGSSGIWKQTPSLCHANTYSGPQLANPVGRIGLNQTGPYGNELLDFNPDIKWMDEICNGKRPMEADGISNRVLMFNGLSPSLTTQGESSSRAFVSPNQFQAMPPPEQQQLEEANEISNHVLMFNGLSPSYTTQGESSSRAFVSPNQFQAMPPPEQEQLEEKEFDDLLDSFRSSSPGRLHLSNSVSGIAVNQAGPISSELLKVNPDVNHWRVFFQSPSYTTQGKSSSRAFVSPNQIQAMPPLEQQWLEEEEFDVLLDSFRSSSPGRSQLSNSASRIAVNQTGPIGSELLEVISDKNPMDEVHYGKRPLEADGISNRILKFNDSSNSCATQGESSSGAFVSTNQFQEMGPPEQHKQLEEEECNGLLDFYRSSNPEEQSMYQQEWGGGLVDPQFDI